MALFEEISDSSLQKANFYYLLTTLIASTLFIANLMSRGGIGSADIVVLLIIFSLYFIWRKFGIKKADSPIMMAGEASLIPGLFAGLAIAGLIREPLGNLIGSEIAIGIVIILGLITVILPGHFIEKQADEETRKENNPNIIRNIREKLF